MFSPFNRRKKHFSIPVDKLGTTDSKPQSPDEYEDVFLIDDKEKRPMSSRSFDSGLIPSRQNSALTKSRPGSRPSTASIPRRRPSYSVDTQYGFPSRPNTAGEPSKEVTRPYTVSSGFQSAGPIRETPRGGWLPNVDNVKEVETKTNDEEKHLPTGLANLINKYSRASSRSERSAEFSLRGISRTDSYKDVDTSKVFVLPISSCQLSSGDSDDESCGGDVNTEIADNTSKKSSTDDTEGDDDIEASLPREKNADAGKVKKRLSVTGHSRKKNKKENDGGKSNMSNATNAKTRNRRNVSSKRLRRSSDTERCNVSIDKRPSGGVTGMSHFGLGKDGTITRTVMIFNNPPRKMPLTTCFHYPNNFLTHRYVLDQVKTHIITIPNGYVTAVQFVDRNVLHGTLGLENRWLISLNCPEARDQLLRTGVKIFNRKIKLRRADDVIDEEYREFLRYQRLMRRLRGEADNGEKPVKKVDLEIDNDTISSDSDSD